MNRRNEFTLTDDNFWTNAFKNHVSPAASPIPSPVPSQHYQEKLVCVSDSEDEKSEREEEEDDEEFRGKQLSSDDEILLEKQKLKEDGSSSGLESYISPTGDDGHENSDNVSLTSWSGISTVSSNPSSYPPLLPMNIRSQYPVIDEKYMEYYEFLSNGFTKLLNEGKRFDMDCDEKGGISCKALKPKYYHQYNPGHEIYSRKVFVGGLPVDVDEEELMATFGQFGSLSVDWPNKQETSSAFPPKGYVFLVFQFEQSVRKLVDACCVEDDKLFFVVASPLSPQKLVQIRPWKLADADYLVDVNIPVNPRRVVFVGGVPRPIRAVELAHIMDRLYGSVACAGIDTDIEHKYPKGAGRVAFTNENSFIRAINDRYAQLSHGEMEKRVRVEMKPYVLDDQPCDECESPNVRHAPFFCPHLDCLQYYCESCWTELHSCPTREHHKPLVKEA